jgi:hypothetical protein
MNQEKYHEAIDLIAEKETNYDVFREAIGKDPQRQWITARLKCIKDAHIREITLTPDDSAFLKEEFLKRNQFLVPRHMRDFPRLIALAKAHALLNYAHRRTEKPDILEANRRDIQIALDLYDNISVANELGIPPQLLDWYQQVLVPIWQSQNEVADRRTILRRHLEVYHQPLNRKRLDDEFMPSLESANLITTEQDPDDRQRLLYTPLRNGLNYVPQVRDTPPTPTITHPGNISRQDHMGESIG